MSQRLLQCDSRFTLDGKPAAKVDVAIGLKPQVVGSAPVFSPKSGLMPIWKKLDGYGLGTGIAIDPARLVKMESHTDAAGQAQALCLARTDESGHIRWFAGFGWEGQGEITSATQWTAYFKTFAGKFVKKPYAQPTFKVHSLEVPAPAAPAKAESSEAVR